MKRKGQPHSILIATAWMMGTLLSFMAMAIGGRELSADLSTFQILFFRSLIGLIIISSIAYTTNLKPFYTNQLKLHLIRNLAHFGGQYGWFYGIAYITLAEVFAIEFTLPVWTALLAMVILNERLTFHRIAAIIFGILGMIIILRPGLGIMTPVTFIVLASAICYALSHTLTKKITQFDSPVTILFYMTLIQLPIGLYFSLDNWQAPTLNLIPWIAIVGITALSGHYCMAKALTIAPATVVVPMDFLRLPLIAIVGYLFYNEFIDIFVLIGASVMLAGNFINIKAERRKSHPQFKDSIK